MNQFVELASVDVSEHTETKGQFSYLSWPFAVRELGQRFPEATWDVKHFPLAYVSGDEWAVNADIQVPYLRTPAGVFVEVAVTVGNVTKTQVHPVLDNRNRPVAKPDAFHINTSIQRCLVKAIGLHGLGLYIYAGEDLPTLEIDGQMNYEKVDMVKVSSIADLCIEVIDEYGSDPDMAHVKAHELFDPLSSDEQMELMNLLKKRRFLGKGDRARQGSSVFREYLDHKGEAA